jgi:hypothetical protein
MKCKKSVKEENMSSAVSDTHEIRSLAGLSSVSGSFFDDTTTLQNRVSPGKNTVDDSDASTITITLYLSLSIKMDFYLTTLPAPRLSPRYTCVKIGNHNKHSLLLNIPFIVNWTTYARIPLNMQSNILANASEVWKFFPSNRKWPKYFF